MITALYILAGLYIVSLFVRRGLTLAYVRTLPPLPKEPLPPGTLTIAQAILSGDPLLESRLAENLKALKGQTFRWLIDEDDAEAQRIAEKLKCPSLHVKLCPSCPDATNPKLWKLMAAAQKVQTPFFAVLDDDTTLSEASAAALVEAAKTHTVATGLPCYLSRGFSSHLLAQFVNDNSIFTYLGTSRLLPPFTLNGMGYVMRTEELERIGYFKPILNELTDDLALATLVLKLGGTIHQSAAPMQVQTGVRNIRHYWQMMHRWYVFTMLLLQRQRISSQAMIFLLHGLPPILMVSMLVLAIATGQVSVWLPVLLVCFYLTTRLHFLLGQIIALPSAVAMMLMGDQPFSYLLLIVLFLRGSLLSSVQHRYFGSDLHRPLISLLSELIQPLHLIHSLSSRAIRWRTRLYKVRDTNDFSAA
ncbi:glycosyltransferase [Prosthecobacter sp.]|uniref:glycosyltransferase n=1 Tax=Prosthecobacter sp. TaxID=1965333 RepID=UPI0037834856